MPMSAAQICLLAGQIAKGPGMTAIAGQYLNVILTDLWKKRDLMINRVTVPLIVQAASYGPFALPADYNRTYDIFYQIPASPGGTVSSITQFLASATMQEFDSEFKSPSIINYPYEFANDMSTDAQTWSGGTTGSGTLTSAGQMFIYPQSSGQLTLTHRYMKRQPDIVTPETSALIPWFEDQQYLIHETAAYLMGVTGDDREDSYHAKAENILRPYLIMEGSEQAAVKMITLDPRHFHFARGIKPTKAMPF
jgi:hypothetical protein